MKAPLILLAAVAVFSSVVSGQTSNYFLESQNRALEMKSYYDEEVLFWRDMLNDEAEDLGSVFVYMITENMYRASTAAQGTQMQSCSKAAADSAHQNILLLDHYVNITEAAANNLQLSVLQQLRTMNVKEYDLELFYYYHGYVMEEAFYNLQFTYQLQMYNAWAEIYLSFFYIYDDLILCVENVLRK